MQQDPFGDDLAASVASLALSEPAQQQQQRSSRWDTLPVELQLHILSFASLLTRFLCGALRQPRAEQQQQQHQQQQLDDDTIDELWTEAIVTDWQGDLSLLPDIELDSGEDGRSLPMMAVSSRSLYTRLCARFPAQSSSRTYRQTDRAYNAASIRRPAGMRAQQPPPVSTQMRQIAMRNCWTDVLDMSHPVALGWYAIECGHTALLSHLSTHCGVDLAAYDRSWFGARAMDVAAMGGHVPVLRLMHGAGSAAASTDAMDWAARGGWLDAVIWLHEHRTEGCTKRAMDDAAQGGHLHVVMWLHANRREGCTTHAMDWATRHGHLDVVRWLHANRSEGCTAKALLDAARNGDVDMVECLIDDGGQMPTVEAMSEAALLGRLGVVECLVGRLWPSGVDRDTISGVADSIRGKPSLLDVTELFDRLLAK